MKNYNIFEYEGRLFDWLVCERHKLVVFLLSGIVVVILSYLPYFNILLSLTIILFIDVIVAVIIFNISVRYILVAAILSLTLALEFLLFQKYVIAELLGNYAYGLLFIASILFIKETKE